MKILLDTNFILVCAKQGIDFNSFANKIINEEIKWIVPQDVLNELSSLKNRNRMKLSDKNAAKLGFEIIQNLKPEIVKLSGKNPNIDIKIVNYIMRKDIVLATLDKGLKEKVDNKILTIRGKNKLEIIDY